jgi:hypothetical protein
LAAGEGHLETARMELGRDLRLLHRLQEHNPGSPSLRAVRDHLEAACLAMAATPNGSNGSGGLRGNL